MEVLIHSETDVQHTLEIVVTPDELKTHFDKALREKAKTILLPGFRKGKAPLPLVRKYIGGSLDAETIEKLSNQLFQDALEERNIRPVGQPQLLDMDYAPGTSLTLKIAYETHPEIIAQEYKGLQLERWSHEVTDNEIEDEIRYIQKQHRKLEEAEVADEEGYLVTCELQMLDDAGEPIPGKVNENLKLDLGEDNVHRDLKAELLNMRTGEEKDIELMYENKDGQEELERFHLKVKSIEKIILPDIDDEFAKTTSNGKHDSLEELRASIRDNLAAYWSRQYDDKLKNDLIAEIIKRNPLTVPPTIVNQLLDGFVEEIKKQHKETGRPVPADFEEYRKHREPDARATAHWVYLRNSIIEQEGLKVSDELLEKKAMDDAVRLGIDKDRLMEFYRRSDHVLNDFLIESLMGFLLDNADINDVNDNDVSNTTLAPFEEIAQMVGVDDTASDVDAMDADPMNADGSAPASEAFNGDIVEDEETKSPA